MQSRDDFPSHWLSATPLGVRSLVKPPMQCVNVDVKNKDAIEEIYELRKIPRATTEERHCFILVGYQGLHFVHMPDVVLVCEAIHWCTGFRIALISQFAVTMNGLVAPPLQFFADRSLAGAGNAFDQKIPPAHSAW